MRGGGFGMGAAAADYDADGDTDLFVTNYGRNLLYRNRGDGTFEEIAREAGLDASGWFTQAVWFDYDNDARLDLFVSGFVSYSLSAAKFCGDNEIGRRHYCVPPLFPGLPAATCTATRGAARSRTSARNPASPTSVARRSAP